MLKYLISPMKITGILFLFSGLFIFLYLKEHISNIGPYISMLGVLILLTEFLMDSYPIKSRRKKLMEYFLVMMISALVFALILDIIGIISIQNLIRI